MGRRRKPAEESHEATFPGQCIWTTGKKQCQLRACFSPSTTGGPGYCLWHASCSLERLPSWDRRLFSEWLEAARREEWPRVKSGDRPYFTLYTEDEWWSAVTGEQRLPAPPEKGEEKKRGIVSRELNGFATGPGGLMGRVLEARGRRASDEAMEIAFADLDVDHLPAHLDGDQARALLNAKADAIRRRHESEAF